MKRNQTLFPLRYGRGTQKVSLYAPTTALPYYRLAYQMGGKGLQRAFESFEKIPKSWDKKWWAMQDSNLRPTACKAAALAAAPIAPQKRLANEKEANPFVKRTYSSPAN